MVILLKQGPGSLPDLVSGELQCLIDIILIQISPKFILCGPIGS